MHEPIVIEIDNDISDDEDTKRTYEVVGCKCEWTPTLDGFDENSYPIFSMDITMHFALVSLNNNERLMLATEKLAGIPALNPLFTNPDKTYREAVPYNG